MFNSVLYIRELCQERNIPISQLEKACSFSNGYLNPKKLKKIPYDKAIAISEYLSIPVEEIFNGPQKEKTPTPEGKREISDDEIKLALFGGKGEVTDEMWEEAKFAVQLIKDRHKRKKGE